ncbi:MAG: hypothetical protein ACKVZ0_20955 [Gemmatimonadales bacterium]
MALSARPGINSCATVAHKLRPDTPQPPGTTRLGFQELRGPETFFPWGETPRSPDGSLVNLMHDPSQGGWYVQIAARVCGGGFGGSPGRFKAIYRVWWQ